MNKTIIAFIAGAVIGSITTWQLVKQKYELIADEEILSVKEYYARKNSQRYEGPQDSEEAEERTSSVPEKPDISEYAKQLSQQGYTSYDKYSAKDEESKTGTPREKPYVISPDEFGEIEEYSKISLFYYADGVLCDDRDVPVDNLDEIVGADFASHFGEYEDDSVFVRNDARRCDYEILRSLKAYSEVLEENPYKAEV